MTREATLDSRQDILRTAWCPRFASALWTLTWVEGREAASNVVQKPNNSDRGAQPNSTPIKEP